MGATTSKHQDTTEMSIKPVSTLTPKSNPGLPPRPLSSFPPSTMVNARAGPGPSTMARAPPPSKNEDKEEGEISDEDDEIQYLSGPPTPFKREVAPKRPSANSSQQRTPARESKAAKKAAKHAAKNAKKQKQTNLAKSAPPRLPPAPLPPPRQPPPVLVQTTKEVVASGPDEVESQLSGPGTVSNAMSPVVSDAVEQEKELIRGLMADQISTQDLIAMGANPLYVTAVCEEILAAKAAKAKLPNPNLPTPNRPIDQPPANPSPLLARLSAPMGRQSSCASQSSQTSEEGLVDSMMGPASPKDGSSVKMVASSSWQPLPPPPVTAYPFVPPPPPVRIESYRPPTPPGRPPPDAPTSLSSNGSQASTTLTATMRNLHPLSSYSGPPLVSPVPTRQQNPYLPPPPPPPQENPYLPPPQQNPYLPAPPQQQNPYFPHSQPNLQLPPPQPNPYLPQTQIQQNHHQIQPLPHRASLPPKPPAPTSFGPGPPMIGMYSDNNRQYPHQNGQMAVTLPNPYSFVNPPMPVLEQTPSPRLAKSELSARTALLETRRKAFESMKMRREANRPTQPIPAEPVPAPVDMSLLDDTPIIIDDDDDSVPDKTIEEQMAELEEEVMGLQNQQAMEIAAADAQDDIDMEIESTEDGEIEDIPEPPKLPISASSTPILSVPSLAPSSGSSTAVKIPSRGTKRLNAEDMMDNRPSTMPARLNPHKRRSLFGGMPQRPNRLMMLVDQPDSDSDGDDDNDDPQMSKLKITSGNSTPNDTAKLLAEKEDSIKKLREQIERRLKAKLAKRVTPVVEVKKEEVEVKVEEPIQVAEAPVVEEMKEIESEVEVKQERDVDMEDSSEPLATGPEVSQSALPVDHDPAVTNVSTPDQVMEITASPAPTDSELPSATQQTPNPYFRTFTPLLPRYPQLNVTPTSNMPRQVEVASARRVDDIDKNLLVSIILTRRLQKEPEVMLCAAETAGGSCADITCGDIHLVKGMICDDDLVEYLSLVHPGKEKSDLVAKLGAAKSVSGYKGQGGTANRSNQQAQKGKSKTAAATPMTNGDDGKIDMVDVKSLVSRVGRLIAAG